MLSFICRIYYSKFSVDLRDAIRFSFESCLADSFPLVVLTMRLFSFWDDLRAEPLDPIKTQELSTIIMSSVALSVWMPFDN